MSKTTKSIVVVITMIAVIISSILVKQEFIRTLPLVISLFVMLFQADANRYAYLAGGINAIVYGFVYWSLGLYASFASAVLFSFPIQILTFFNWQKHSYKSSTTFKKMSIKGRILTSAGFVAVWVGVFAALKISGGQYAFLDNTVSLLGILVSVLTMLAYIEYSYIWLVSSALSIILNVQVFLNLPSHLPYVIYSLYNMWCVVIAYINVMKLYSQQKEEQICRTK